MVVIIVPLQFRVTFCWENEANNCSACCKKCWTCCKNCSMSWWWKDGWSRLFQPMEAKNWKQLTSQSWKEVPHKSVKEWASEWVYGSVQRFIQLLEPMVPWFLDMFLHKMLKFDFTVMFISDSWMHSLVWIGPGMNNYYF